MICENIKDCPKGHLCNCFEEKNCSSITVQENNKKYQLDNPFHAYVKIIHIDGGAIDDNSTIRCDYAMSISGAISSCVFIELKGSNILHALKQLCQTARRYTELYNLMHGVIVCSKVNGPCWKASAEYQTAKQIFNKDIVIKEKILIENLAVLFN